MPGSIRSSWSRPLAGLSPRARAGLWAASFLVPVLLWGVVSYVPFIWHPMVRITTSGDVAWMTPGLLVERAAFASENAEAVARGARAAAGEPANPVFLPAPHAVMRALVTGFTTPPARPDEPWLHQSLWHSIQVIFWGFFFSSIIGVPLGILCGALPALGRLTEPFIEFFRYLPAPAFGALAVAVLGIEDAPKVAIIFVGTFFQQVLVIANTTRRIDPALLEAAETLGASRRALITRVVVPGVITEIYTDMRVLLGWAWTYLIVAELIGVSSGITYFINQQGKYRNYERVFASIILIGLIGLVTDVVLVSLGRQLFPWSRGARRGWLSGLLDLVRGRAGHSQTRPSVAEPVAASVAAGDGEVPAAGGAVVRP
jgi:NitT/TauT family transport system permease protein